MAKHGKFRGVDDLKKSLVPHAADRVALVGPDVQLLFTIWHADAEASLRIALDDPRHVALKHVAGTQELQIQKIREQHIAVGAHSQTKLPRVMSQDP